MDFFKNYIENYFNEVIHILEGILILITTTDKILQFLSTDSSNIFAFLVYLRVLKALLFFRVIKYNVFASNMITIAQ